MAGGAKVGLYAMLRLGVRYGPLALEAVRRTRGPAATLTARQLSRRSAQRAAYEHARHLIDGFVLPVYEGDTRVWVVFSGEVPVATHPVTRTPVQTLLRHYDLSLRAQPPAAPRTLRPLRTVPGLTSAPTLDQLMPQPQARPPSGGSL